MKYRWQTHKKLPLLGAVVLMAFLPRIGFSAIITNVWYLDVATNYAGSDYPSGVDYLYRHAFVQTNARWGVDAGLTTNRSGENRPQDSYCYYLINFLPLTNYYVPASTSLYLEYDDSWKTNRYVPYTKTLTVTVAGTLSNVVWHFSSCGELTNSSAYQAAYTNTATLTPIPTGTYTMVFPLVEGYAAPGSVTTNITESSPMTNGITGTYVRACGTITVSVNLTNGSWEFTGYPPDFAEYSASALGGTNSGTLTNAPAGAYTIHYGPVSGYNAPSDATMTNTVASPNLTFFGGYALGSSALTVRFRPPAIQTTAQWWVYDETTLTMHGPFTNNYAKGLTSSNDYTVSHSVMRDYYEPADAQLPGFIGDRILTNTYLPYTNNLRITTVNERTNGIAAAWTISAYPSEFTNSTAYIGNGTNGSGFGEYASVPTGTYRVTYHSATGYFNPAPAMQTVLVTGASSGDFTGTYVRACGTITVSVNLTNGSWEFTGYPPDFAEYSASALGGTNSGTLTNAPAGSYTIHYNNIGSPYVAPADLTRTNTCASTNLAFTGAYSIDAQSWLTVDFEPVAVRYPLDRAWAHWCAAGSEWMDHNESVRLYNGFDYIVYYSAVKNYYPPSPDILPVMFGDATITKRYFPFTNSLAVTVAGVTTGVIWGLSCQNPEFTNAVSYGTAFTNTYTVASIPTGLYTVTFPAVPGYVTPSAVATNITGSSPLVNGITGTYASETNNPPAKPMGLIASDGTYTNKIRVTWNAVNNAAGYQVWRSATNNSASAGLLATTVSATYDDMSATTPGLTLYYWVKATNSAGVSAFSLPDAGYCGGGGEAGTADLALRGFLFQPAVMTNNAHPEMVMLVVVNNGPHILADSGIGFDFYLSRNTVFGDGDDEWIGDYAVTTSIGADGYTSVIVSDAGVGGIAIPAAASGAYYIFSKVKHTSAMLDPNMANNTAMRSGAIMIGTGGGAKAPVAGDFDGDRKADPCVYQESTGNWQVKLSGGGYGLVELEGFGGEGWKAESGDYDGDGRADPAIYRESTGDWRIKLSGAGYAEVSTSLGGLGYAAVSGDFNGGGNSDLAVYREATGYWLFLLAETATPLYFKFGQDGYAPVTGDYTGDGTTDLALYQEATGSWFVRQDDTILSLTGFGGTGWQPVGGDYDGDGKEDLMLYLPTVPSAAQPMQAGQAEGGNWIVRLSASGYTIAMLEGFGGAEYVPVSGDYDGDGKADLVLFKAAGAVWLIRLSSQGYAQVTTTF